MPRLKKQSTQQKVQVIRHEDEPVAVVLDIDDYYDLLELANPRIQHEIEQAKKEIAEGKTISHEALMKQLGL